MLGNAGGGKDPCFWCAGEGGNRAVIDDESTTPRTTVTFRSRCVAVRSEKSSVSSLGTMWWGPLAWVLRWKQSESWMFEMDTSSLMSGEGKRVGCFWFRGRALPRLYAQAASLVKRQRLHARQGSCPVRQSRSSTFPALWLQKRINGSSKNCAASTT